MNTLKELLQGMYTKQGPIFSNTEVDLIKMRVGQWLMQKRQETESLYIHYLNKEAKKDIYRSRLPDKQQFPPYLDFDRMWQLIIDELLEELQK